MKFRKMNHTYWVRLERGEKIMESIIQLARQESIGSASLVGLGAVMNARLGFYHLNRKSYDERLVPEERELVSLIGNVSWLGDTPSVHIHASLGDTDFRAIAGHLFEAEAAVTVEITLQTFDERVARKPSADVGLNLLDL